MFIGAGSPNGRESVVLWFRHVELKEEIRKWVKGGGRLTTCAAVGLWQMKLPESGKSLEKIWHKYYLFSFAPLFVLSPELLWVCYMKCFDAGILEVVVTFCLINEPFQRVSVVDDVFLTGLVISCFLTNTDLQHEKKLEMIRYLRSVQCPDGGWGL